MPLNDAALNIGGNAIRTAITHLALHSAQPDAAGSNQTTAARVAAGWGVAAGGDFTATNKAFTGGAPNGAATHVGFWSAATAGTFYGWFALTGDLTFNSAGELTITSVTLDSSAT